MKNNPISSFVREKRKKAKLTQLEFSKKAGVGLRFLKELESGKETLRIDKINQVLKLFGHELIPGKISINKTTEE